MKKEQKIQKNKEYWRDRVIAQEGSKERRADILSAKTKKAYIRSYKRVQSAINDMYADIMSRDNPIVSRTELYKMHKYRALKELIAKECKGLMLKDGEDLTYLLYSISELTYKNNYEEFGLTFNLLSEQQAKAVVEQNWTGVHFKSRIAKNASDFNVKVMSMIEDLVVAGKNPDELKKELMKQYNGKFYEADRLIRTEASHVYNSAALQSYIDAGCSHIEFLAEDDCCDECEPYSGQVYQIADAPIIPVHPNCRCTYLPVIE